MKLSYRNYVGREVVYDTTEDFPWYHRRRYDIQTYISTHKHAQSDASVDVKIEKYIALAEWRLQNYTHIALGLPRWSGTYLPLELNFKVALEVTNRDQLSLH